MRIVLGFALAFIIGVVCRIARIPSPAPQALMGSLLVVTMSLGYITADHWLLARRPSASLSVSLNSSHFTSGQGETSCK